MTKIRVAVLIAQAHLQRFLDLHPNLDMKADLAEVKFQLAQIESMTDEDDD